MSAKPVFLCSGGPGANRAQQVADFKTVLDACGKPAPRVAYIGTAHLDTAYLWNMVRPMLQKAGAGAVEMVPIVKKPDPAAARSLLQQADAVFLSGGEVEDGIRWLQKAGLVPLLNELYRGGVQFFGISAGCIMMGRHWVHWDKEGDDSTASLFDCLGFLPYTFDAHGEEEDWTELKCALRLLGPGAEGYGLSDGGFFTARAEGNLTAFRSGPAAYHNHNGIILRSE